MSHFMSNSEVSKPTSVLNLVPDRTCPLFYMNSSAGDAQMENFVAKTILKPSKDFKRGGWWTSKKIFATPKTVCVCVCFSISISIKVKVQKGNDFFAFYGEKRASDYEKGPLSWRWKRLLETPSGNTFWKHLGETPSGCSGAKMESLSEWEGGQLSLAGLSRRLIS